MVVAGRLEDNKTRQLNLEILGNSMGGNLVLSMSADDVAGEFTDVQGQTKLTDFAEITGKKLLFTEANARNQNSICHHHRDSWVINTENTNCFFA